MSGQHNDRTLAGKRSHLMQELHAVHDRHLEVGDNDVKIRLIEQAQRLLSVADSLHGVAFAMQNLCLHLGHIALIFD